MCPTADVVTQRFTTREGPWNSGRWQGGHHSDTGGIARTDDAAMHQQAQNSSEDLASRRCRDFVSLPGGHREDRVSGRFDVSRARLASELGSQRVAEGMATT